MRATSHEIPPPHSSPRHIPLLKRQRVLPAYFLPGVNVAATRPNYNPIQYNTLHYDTIQYNAIQYNTIHSDVLTNAFEEVCALDHVVLVHDAC